MIITAVWSGLLASGACTAFVLGTLLLGRYPLLVPTVAAVIVVIEWEIPQLPALVVVGGTHIYLLDILSVALIAISTPHILHLTQSRPVIVILWLVFLCLLLFSLLRGISGHGFNTAVNEFRGFFAFFGALQWSFTLKWNSRMVSAVMYRGSLALGWALTGMTMLHIALYGLGGASSFVDVTTDIVQTGRPLTAGQALMLLLCGILTFANWVRSRRAIVAVSAVVFLLGVVVTQQRSDWAAALAAGVIVVVMGGARLRARLATAVCFSAIFTTVVIGSGSARPLLTELLNSAQNAGTYDAREMSWHALMGQFMASGNFASVLFGAPMGSGYGRFEGPGHWVDFAPHNWYVTVLLRTGLVGITVFLALLATAAVVLIRQRDTVYCALFVALIVFAWTYSWPWYAAIPLGWVVANVLQNRSSRDRDTQQTKVGLRSMRIDPIDTRGTYVGPMRPNRLED